MQEPRQEAEPSNAPAQGARVGVEARPEAPAEAGPGALGDDVIRGAARGDPAAWRAVVGAYSARVFALARSRVRRADLAEEITQSVFATVAAKLASGGYEERGRFESWLFRVAMNRVRDEIRRSRHRAAAADPAVLAERSVEADARTEADELGRLREALAELNDADREIIELRHHGQVAFKEIAVMLGEPMGTVLARHHRALAKLRTVMDRQKAAVPGDRHE